MYKYGGSVVVWYGGTVDGGEAWRGVVRRGVDIIGNPKTIKTTTYLVTSREPSKPARWSAV